MMSPIKKCRVEEDQQLSDDGAKERDVINILSLDSLANIFMLLPLADRIKLEKVCSKWEDACQLAWHDIKKYKCGNTIGRSYNNRMLTQSYVEKVLLRCGKYLKELILSEVCNSTIMPLVRIWCKNLTKFEFEFDEFQNNYNIHIVNTFRQLDNLESIKINVVNAQHLKSKIFPSEMIECLSEKIKEIHLLFYPVGRCDTKPYKPIKNKLCFNLNKFNNLQTLELRECNLSNIIQAISEKRSLVNLDLRCFEMDEINSLSFNQLVNLERITLMNYVILKNDYVEGFSQNFVSSIFNTCKNLQYVNLKNSIVEPCNIQHVNWLNLINLVYLDVDFILTDDVANKIVNYCKNLEFLHIYYYFNEETFTDSSIKKISELKNLQSLRFHDFDIFSEESIITISNNFKKLKNLKIQFLALFPSFDRRELILSTSALDEFSKLQYLEELDLSYLTLQDSNIIAIANNCKNLKTLSLIRCQGFTETALMALTTLENLKSLNVLEVDIITDNFISKLKGLTRLNCSVCKKLTDAGIIQLIKNCPDLENLDISFTNITIDTITAADQETENRKNDIFLDLVLPSNFKQLEFTIESDWLRIFYW